MIGTTQVKCEKRKLAYRRSVWRLPPVPSSLLFIALLVFFPDSAFSAPDRISKKALDEIGALFEEKAAWTPRKKNWNRN